VGAEDTNDEALRARATVRVKSRRNFFRHLAVYAAVNALLVTIWALGSRGFFWPIFVIVGWGILVVANASHVFGKDDEARVRNEMDRLKRQDG
jgi:2TM domain